MLLLYQVLSGVPLITVVSGGMNIIMRRVKLYVVLDKLQAQLCMKS